MQITARAEYATQAVVELASREPTGATRGELSAAQGIPGKFLEGILGDLTRSGLLAARRGPAGGYRLAVPSERLTLADVIRAVDGPLAAVHGLPPESVEYAGPAAPLREVWVALRASMRAVLETTTIAAVLRCDFNAEVQQLLGDEGVWQRRSARPR